MAEVGLPTEVRDFLQGWVESVSQVITQTGGTPFVGLLSTASPADLPVPADSDLHFRFSLAGGLRGEMNLRATVPVALALGQLILQEPLRPDAELTADHRDGAKELLSQIGGHAATALKPRWGEVQIAAQDETSRTWQPAAVAWVVPSEGASPSIQLEFQLSAALLAALRPTAEFTSANTELLTGAAQQAGPYPKLDLLMDVELDLTLRFGSRQMMLRQILELSSGSVVQLDRQVNDPADLLLGERLIARGQVVVVEGNYGLRITELISPPVRSNS